MTEATEKQPEQIQRYEKDSLSLVLPMLLRVHELGFRELLEYRVLFVCSSEIVEHSIGY